MKISGPFLVVPLVLLFLNFPITVGHTQEQSDTGNPSLKSKFKELMTTLYCPCEGCRQTVQDCSCGLADQAEAEFRKRLAAGGTVEQIRQDFLAKYGTWYSAVMPAEGFNLVAYIMPAIIIVLLGGVVFFVLKSKRASPFTRQASKSTVYDEQTLRRIEEDLQRYKQQH